MNRRSQGFTLIELLIAFALSSFIIFSLMQSYQSLMRYIETSREMMRVNRKACLLFNLFERDAMCAMIPELAKEVTPLKDEKVLEKVRREKQEREKEQEDTQPKTEEQKKKERQKELEKKATFFKSSIEQSMGVKTPTGRYELLKGLTFITTNCLQVYGQKRVKLVRVKYELLQDKKNSKRDKPVYKLVRKETRELENEKMKINELDFARMKTNPIKQYLIADNLKGLYIAYVTHKPEEKKKKSRSKPVSPEQREVRYYAWSEKKETKGVVPQRIEMRLEFWNAKMNDTHVFEAMFPILGYPSKPIEDEKDKKNNQAEQPDQAEQPADQQAGPEGVLA